VLEAVVEHGEVAQAEEVHLQQAERLAGTHVELGDDRAVLLAAVDRDDVEQRLAAQDDAGGVHAPLALEPLEPAGGVDDCLASGRSRRARGTRRPRRSACGSGRRSRTAGCPCP
jgi:hypothetical protein